MSEFSSRCPNSAGCSGDQLRNAAQKSASQPEELLEPYEVVGRNDLFPALALLWIAVNCIDAQPRRARRTVRKHEDVVLCDIDEGCQKTSV